MIHGSSAAWTQCSTHSVPYAFSVGFITIAENPLTDTKRRRWGVHNSFTYGDSLLGHSGSYITMNVAIVAD
ncbi:MAG: hypothetical protein V7771_04400 [Shewanella psychromarinicola]|uniref:hypothetical protein n=1 Tax=Shewanella psychromarinicola TaxID=2487742 RepID=UPI003002CA29